MPTIEQIDRYNYSSVEQYMKHCSDQMRREPAFLEMVNMLVKTENDAFRAGFKMGYALRRRRAPPV